MSSFFISPFKPPEEWFGESDLEVDPMSLMGNLQSRWPSIDITLNPNIPYKTQLDHFPILEWEWENKESNYYMRGHLFSNKQIIVFEGSPKELLAEFVIWCRSLISSKYRLFFYHESLYLCMEIDSATSFDELVHTIQGGSK